MSWEPFFSLFQSKDITLQFDTKVKELCILEILQKCQTHEKEVNHETTPPNLWDQFMTCDLKDLAMIFVTAILYVY